MGDHSGLLGTWVLFVASRVSRSVDLELQVNLSSSIAKLLLRLIMIKID